MSDMMNSRCKIRPFDSCDTDGFIRLALLSAGGGPEEEKEAERRNLLSLERPGFKPARDLLLAEDPGGRLAGYGRCFKEAAISRQLVEVFVSPRHRRRGIGSRLMERLLALGRKAGAVICHTRLIEGSREADFCLRLGFRPVRRYLEMSCDLAGVARGANDENVGPFDRFSAGEENRLAKLQNGSFRGSWGFCPNSSEDIHFFLRATRCSLEDVILLKQEERDAGYLWPSFAHEKIPSDGTRPARIHMLGLLPVYRGRGRSRNLLRCGLADLRNRGYLRAVLTVDAENTPALALYSSLGFKTEFGWIWYERGIDSGSP